GSVRPETSSPAAVTAPAMCGSGWVWAAAGAARASRAARVAMTVRRMCRESVDAAQARAGTGNRSCGLPGEGQQQLEQATRGLEVRAGAAALDQLDLRRRQ